MSRDSQDETLVHIGGAPRPRLPEWARKSRTHFESLNHLKRGLRERKLHTVCEVRRALPQARVEVLTPDFCGDLGAVARVLDARPHVFNHNMETVPRLYTRVRPQADYRQSLDVLAFARRHAPDVLTKSGFM